MTQPLQIRILTPGDLPFAGSVRALAGWNQTLDDWRRFLAMEPEGCFLAEWEGQPAGTATTLRYGPDLAWIGMVLVHPDLQRRGIGKALLHHCIGWLQERRVRCIKLDATPAGKVVYDALGFQDEWTLNRWEHAGLSLEKSADARLRPWREGDAGLTAPLDVAAFGVPRCVLAEALARQSRGFVFERVPGRIGGYGFLRPGSRASYLGPIVAESAEAGLVLAQALLATGGAGRVFWDIPDANRAAVDWARAHGFEPQRLLTRMFLGENATPGDPAMQFALAAPEVG